MNIVITSPKTDLSPDRYNFCRFLVSDPQMNHKEAYLKVSPNVSDSSASQIANRWLKEPEVCAYIAELMLERQKRLEIDEDWVITRLRDIHDRCVQAEPVWEGQRYQRDDETGDTVEKEPSYYKFDATGALKALELMGRHMRMFSDKTDGAPMQLDIKIDLGSRKDPIEGQYKRVGH